MKLHRLLPIVALWAFLLSIEAFGQAAPFIKWQQFTALGTVPAAGYKLCSYAAGTTTPLATYATAADANAGTNPISPPRTLDSSGRLDLFLGSSSYKLILAAPGTGGINCNGSQFGTTVWTEDNIAFLPLVITVNTITAKTINNVQYCNAYGTNSSTADVRIAACIAALPTTGGVADARGIQGSQSINADVFTTVTKPVALLISGATFGVNVPVTIPNNISVSFSEGALFNVATAQTLTMNGPIDAGLTRIFSGSGSSFVGPTSVSHIYPQWFGAVGDGSTDDSTPFQRAINTGREIVIPQAVYKITTPLTAVSNMTLTGEGYPTLAASVAGKQVLSGVSLSNFTIRKIFFTGVNSSTTPSEMIGGQAATSTGLVSCNYCTDVKVEDSSFSTFYNGFTAIRGARVSFQRNIVTHWLLYGFLGSESFNSKIDFNWFLTCDQTGNADAYAGMITGDPAGGHPSYANSFSFNVVDGVKSWDGFMSHDIDGLDVIGNDIRDVRNCLDFGIGIATNVITNLRVQGNYCKSTTTDTRPGVAANHSGILLNGGASSQVRNSTISGNIVDSWYNISGLTLAGDASNYVCSYCDNVTFTGNEVRNAGSQQGNAGYLIGGTINGLSINGGILQGTMASGGVRLVGITGADISIGGGLVIRQTNTSDFGVYFSGTSTITNLSLCGFASNSVAGSEWFINAGSVLFKAGCRPNYYSETAVDPPNLADGATYAAAVACTGAILGDLAMASFSLDTQGILLTATVSSADTMTAVFQNETGGAIDLGTGTLRCLLFARNR